jgi:hypothetical protein
MICMAAQVRSSEIERGGEWLSWSPRERATYVNGFITGYLQGSHEACEVAEQLFGEPGKMYSLGDEHHPSEMPSARCLSRMQTYSKQFADSGVNPSAYVDVITEFYTKHPEYRAIPFANIMDALSDSRYKTADQLHQMALKGEWPLRPVR